MTSCVFGFCPECSLGCAVPEVHEGAGWLSGRQAASSPTCPCQQRQGLQEGGTFGPWSGDLKGDGSCEINSLRCWAMLYMLVLCINLLYIWES